MRLTILDNPLLEEEAIKDPDGRGIWPLPRTLTARLGGFNLWVLLYSDEGTSGWLSSCR